MDGQDNNIKLVSVFQPRDTMQASMIRDALQQNGIDCCIENENFSNVRLGGWGTGAGTMNVLVSSEKADLAKEILADLGFE